MNNTVTDTGLDQAEERAARVMAQVVQDEPENINKVIQAFGLDPQQDPYDKVMQLLLIQTLVPQDQFSATIDKHVEQRHALGLASIFGAVGSIFKKKEGGTKIGNFFRRIFGKGQPGTGVPMSPAEQQVILQQIEDEKKKKEEEEKAKKTRNMWIFGGVAAAFIIIVILIVVIAGKKKPATA